MFSSWARWNSERRTRIPSRHQNSTTWLVVSTDGLCARTPVGLSFAQRGVQEVRKAREYLNLGELPSLEPRIAPDRFNQLALQLVASGLCATKSDVERLVCSTFRRVTRTESQSQSVCRMARKDLRRDRHAAVRYPAHSKQQRPADGDACWKKRLPTADCNRSLGLFLLKYATDKAQRLISYLPTAGKSGDTERLIFVTFAACLSCPEFRPSEGTSPTRILPYPP